MKLHPAFLGLFLITGLTSVSVAPRNTYEIVIANEECVVRSTGGVHLEIEAKGITRGQAGATIVKGPAVLRVSASAPYTLTLTGPPQFEVELRDADGRGKPLRIAGSTIRLHGDSADVSISEARMIKVLD